MRAFSALATLTLVGDATFCEIEGVGVSLVAGGALLVLKQLQIFFRVFFVFGWRDETLGLDGLTGRARGEGEAPSSRFRVVARVHARAS